jgi:hypothetical protein
MIHRGTLPDHTTDYVHVWRDPNWRLTLLMRTFIFGVMPNHMYRVLQDASLGELAKPLLSGRSAALLIAAAVLLALPSDALG